MVCVHEGVFDAQLRLRCLMVRTWSWQDHWRLSGIDRDVELVCVPAHEGLSISDYRSDSQSVSCHSIR